METKHLVLPKEKDTKMVVAALLTVAACSLDMPLPEAERLACSMYAHILNTAEKLDLEKEMNLYEKLGKKL
ncbi:hypothetical protein [Desulfovibrio psychrotolerans]|uniref:Lipoprotein n=1 Tax=Desulfovibrio psychrotolerans TaxID=415242 RepID=A0A7J0BW79_9BACT|nr:hypothetical protein [Desulfovibrio psychrotolerans]GFM37967.1 hypothetical protein DSM19430T_26510 [Desulfovibrio psychrotolerans]